MEQDNETEELVQAFRPVHKDNLFLITPAAVAHVAIHTDPSNGKKIILWDDILHGFKDAAHARHGTNIIPFIKDSNFKNLDPLRFIAFPNAILDIVVDGKFTSTDPHPSVSKLQQIANQSTQFPRYNPIDMLAPISMPQLSRAASYAHSRHSPVNTPPLTSMPQLSRAVSNAHSSYRPDRTIPPPSFWNQGRGSSHPAQPPPRPTPVKLPARVDVREAFKRVILHIDLEVLEEMGEGTPQEFTKALECYLVAFCQGHSHGHQGRSHSLAQLSVGDLFHQGEGVVQDTSRAFEWYLKLASQGNAIAQRKISRLIFIQPSRPPAAPEATSGTLILAAPLEPTIISPATAPAETLAGMTVGEIAYALPDSETVTETQGPYGTEEITETSEDNTQTPTLSGNGENFHHSEKVHVESKRVPSTIDYTETAAPQFIGGSPARSPQQSWRDDDLTPVIYYQPRNFDVRRSPQLNTGDFEQTLANAQYGDTTAQVRLGDMHLEMYEVQQDDAAMYWYLKAALHGYTDGQHRVGLMFLEGRGVQQSYSRAMEWCLKAAEQGKAEGQILVGYMYENGHDVVKNYTRAMDWYCKAAAQGSGVAQNNVGVMFENGYGVPKSYSKAMKWYRKAVDQGHEIAQTNLVNAEKKRNPIRSRLKRLLS
ncbi:hypothetical protein EC957_008108 [Mortierella hygrophila]|uniref:HCP-like protein n=1 Tax=Mortierella hygrophila TaxID=979708 RepID=A0A9P6FIE3_9FUNG|nr:hypothetical protein EC957_008108 [Mortierella hygrophila]